jgi:phi13 family phage major tail protein
MTVSVNSSEYKSRIGLDNLHIAEVTQDDSSDFVADTPETLAPAAKAAQKPNSSVETQYADDAAFDVAYAEGDSEIELEVTALPTAMLAKIMGRPFDAASGRMYDVPAEPPFMALSFRSKKSNGSYRYYQFLKGKFAMPEEEAETAADSPNPKTTKLIFKAVHTTHKFDVGEDENKAVKRVVGDEDTTNFDGSTWFNAVQTPDVAAASALALDSIVPADEAVGVVVTADVVMTFNNALVNNAVNNVMLLDSAGDVVAGSVTLNATKKVLTINPTASLGAAEEHIVVIAGVMDVFGQTLSASKTFTTA